MKNVAKTVRLPAALWDRLEAAAEDDQRTVNGMIWHLLDHAVGGPRAAEGGERRKAPTERWFFGEGPDGAGREARHPWYGPCDALGPDGVCAECYARRCLETKAPVDGWGEP